MTESLSIQEALYPELTCFGCGHANPDGFHLRSYRDGDLTVAEFTPRPEHDNGFGFLNGGIIATVLDCHGAAVVMWEAAQHGWQAAPGAPVPFITADFKVQFLRPTPLGETVRLTATPVTLDDAQIVVRSDLEVDDKQRATMTATWRRFRAHPQSRAVQSDRAEADRRSRVGRGARPSYGPRVRRSRANPAGRCRCRARRRSSVVR